MRDVNPRTAVTRFGSVLAFGLLCSTVAFGLPWDIDMADGQTVKAYEREMIPLPAGTVPQDNMLSPTDWAPNYVLGTAEGNALSNPLEASPEVLATGERMFGVYCTPCHGNGQVLGPVAKLHPGVAVLSGNSAAARLKAINDGRLYLTIRNGFGLMPAYGWSMDETEMWSLVHYARTLPGSQYVPPAPPTQETPK
jgi:mono/diheme cytochrome c family protein